MDHEALTQLVAETFGIAPDRVRDELAYESIPEWDSLNHVNLMLALEQRTGRSIDEDTMVELTTVAAIREFVAR
ncbi:MAG: acyl carrier protein [Myxococcota bacterium]|nr:acyl carrier protein [Myxococcales bacterium]